MVWLILLAITATGSVAYLIIGALPATSGISEGRRKKFHRSGVTLIVLTMVALGKYLTHAS